MRDASSNVSCIKIMNTQIPQKHSQHHINTSAFCPGLGLNINDSLLNRVAALWRRWRIVVLRIMWISNSKISSTNGTFDFLPNKRIIYRIVLFAPGAFNFEFHSRTSSFVFLVTNVRGTASSNGGGQVQHLNLGTQKKPDASPYAVMKVRPRTCSKDDRKTPGKT